jgi:hypothetical protein
LAFRFFFDAFCLVAGVSAGAGAAFGAAPVFSAASAR